MRLSGGFPRQVRDIFPGRVGTPSHDGGTTYFVGSAVREGCERRTVAQVSEEQNR